MEMRHLLLVTFPAQGHINPSLQFAKRLIGLGFRVTFVTSAYAQRRMPKTAAGKMPKGLRFAAFSDGYDDGYKHGAVDWPKYMAEIRSKGSKALRDTIAAAAEDGRPVTCLVYTLLLPWAAQVAHEFHIPSALLWIQASTVLSIYYHYYHGFSEEIIANSNYPSWKIQMPGMQLMLTKNDLPSLILPTTSDGLNLALSTFKEKLDTLDAEERPKVLVNTFDALEADALKAIDKYEQIGIGPLIPSAFLDGQDSSDRSYGGDIFEKCDDYNEWLSSKPKSSVVYVSFGTLLRLPKPQMKEIEKALISSGRPFLWVIRASDEAKGADDGDQFVCLAELERIGKIVPWCSQLEVLTDEAVGCFMTHCGWNSTLESMSCGVPVVAFPHWSDQGTNAKLIEDVWGTGVRVRVGEDGMVGSGEIVRCIEEVMDGGDKSREVRENAKKWKGMARAAMTEDGSSRRNLKAFFEQLGSVGHQR